MSEKILNSRIVNKHDTEENWLKATGFTPKQGELIVYDIDENYNYERIKIGDGVQNVNDLPFAVNRSFVVTVSRDAGNNTIVDKTYQEIYDAAKAGMHVYMVTGDTVYVDGNSMWPDTVLWLSYYSDYSVIFTHHDGSVEYEVEVDSDGGVSVYYSSSLPSKYSFGYEGMVLTVGENGEVNPADFPATIARASDVEEVKELVGDKSVSEQINTAAVNNQSDWSVNDESSPAYVKNRTHWVSVERKAWINNETLLFENFNGAYINQIALDEQILSVGHTYDIVIDDESYNCVAYEFEGMVCLGNLSIMDSSLTNTNESFFIYSPLNDGIGGADGSFIVVATSLDGDSHTITLAADVTTYHKIDENYLPHIVGRPGERIGSEIFNDYKNNFAGGAYAHAEGYSTWASGYASHAEGELTKATFENAHAEGNETTASGSNSHAEGNKTTASSYNAHAEGNATVASGHSSHAEGLRTEASGQGSHAEGHDTKASAYSAHAEGYGTEAAAKSQHVFGEYNIVDKSSGEAIRGKYIQIAGNGGSANARSNAHTLDWSGNAWFKGAIKIGGTGQDDETAKELATKEYVDSFVGGVTVAEQIAQAIQNNTPKITSITLHATSWTGDTNPWSQVVTMNSVTANSKIDLQPTAVQIVELQNEEITLMLQNDEGVVTAWAIGNKPTKDYTMQVLITEVVRV